MSLISLTGLVQVIASDRDERKGELQDGEASIGGEVSFLQAPSAARDLAG